LILGLRTRDVSGEGILLWLLPEDCMIVKRKKKRRILVGVMSDFIG
jgi:hypothetical protein